MSGAGSQSFIAIDVIADITCPWCYIAKRRLEAAIASHHGLSVHTRWRPYQLDPGIPGGGAPWRTYLAKKYGNDRVEDALQAIAAAGREVGLAFAFERIERMPNSLDAHRLVRLAKIGALESRMVERLFKAFFTEGQDVGDRGRLIDLGVEVGLDRDILAEAFARGDDVQSVKDELATTRRLGLMGAPLFIFGDDIVVPGAPSKDVFANALLRAREALSRSH